MSTVRVVRPRPLGVNDRIPVFWAGQEPSQELKAVDGGALYRHLVASSTPTNNRKRKRTEKYHAPVEGTAHEHFSPLRRPHEQQKGPSGPIYIPRVREVENYALNQQAAAPFGPMISGDIAAAPYIRHKELLPGMYEEHEVPEYDADDKDMAWLHNVNSKNGHNGGLFAAAVGLYHQVAQRIGRTSSDAAAATPSTPVEVRLSLDTFEKAINMLELMHFDAVKAWWEEQQSGPTTSAPEIPEIPAMKRLLPRAVALEGLSRLVPDSKLALQLLEYWLRRRQQEGGPLLARLWFEQPWKLVAFAEFVVSDDEDFDEHLPFMAVEPRSAHGKSRRGGNQRRRPISEEDALDALYGLRNELEVLRTLADQVRKREKLKRQLLLVWQQETQMRLQLGLPPTPPIPGVSRPCAGAGSSAAAAGAAAAGVSAAAGAGTSAAAARATAAPPQPVPTGLTDVSKRLAKAAAVAAAAASPAEGSHGRQTRTAAAAAAATFEATFAAKRDMLMPVQRAALRSKLQRSSAAAEAAEQQPAAALAPPAGNRKAAGGAKRGSRGSARARPASAKQPKRSSRAAVAAAAADAGDADDEVDVSSEEPEAAAAASPGTTIYVDAEQVASDEEEEQESPQPPKQRRRVARSVQPGQLARQQQKQKQPAKGGQMAGALRATAAAAAHAAPAAAAAAADSSPSSDDSGDADYTASEDEQEQQKSQQRRQQQQQRQPQQQQHKPRAAGRKVRGSKAALQRPADRRSSSMRGSSSLDEEAANGQEAWQSDEDFKQPSPRTVRYVQHLQEQEQRKQQQQTQQQKQPKQKRLGAAAAAGAAEAEQPSEQQQPIPKQRQGRRMNGVVSRRPGSLAAAASAGGSSEDSGSEEGAVTPKTKGPRTPRRPARVVPALPVAPAYRAASAAATAAAADPADGNPAEHTVLRPHNQQQRAGKQAAGHHKAAGRPGSAAAALAAAAKASQAVAVRSSSGVVQTARPASGSSRGMTAGASVRRVAAAAVASAKRKRDIRRTVGKAELRALGIAAPEQPLSSARSRRR